MLVMVVFFIAFRWIHLSTPLIRLFLLVLILLLMPTLNFLPVWFALSLLRFRLGLGGKSAADKGKDTRDYLAAAFPELNAWERAGADASSAGMVDAGFENQKELTKMQLDNQKEIAEMQNETQKEIAGIQSATSRQN